MLQLTFAALLCSTVVSNCHTTRTQCAATWQHNQNLIARVLFVKHIILGGSCLGGGCPRWYLSQVVIVLGGSCLGGTCPAGCCPDIDDQIHCIY